MSFLFGSRQPIKAGIREDLKTASISQLVDLSRHYDGFVREGVLVRAVELRSPQLLDAILERLNDWVPQVRQAARTALLTLVPLLSSSAILKTLPAIDRLRLAKRENHAAWIDRYHVAVIDAFGTDALFSEAVMGSGEVARACFDIVQAHSLVDAGQLAQRVLENGADFGTSFAAWRLNSRLEADARKALAETGLASSFGAVRTAALRELLTTGGEGADALAEQALLDPQSSVREVAMWHLKQKGYPVAQYYVDRLAQDALTMREMRICLASLAGCGTLDHVALIRQYTDAPRARTQATAVMSWARLAPDDRDNIVRCALLSEFSRVRKLALVLMNDFGAYIDLDEALVLATGRSDYTLALLLARREPWTWITTILKMADNAVGSPRKEYLALELRKWLAASANIYTRPTEAQAREVASPAAQKILKELIGEDGREGVFSPNGAVRQILQLHGLT